MSVIQAKQYPRLILPSHEEIRMCLAVPGKLLTKTTAGGMSCGQVQFGGISREVCLDFVPEVNIGDYVLVHVGFAITRVDEEEARKSYELLEEMGVLSDELGIEPDLSGGNMVPTRTAKS